MIVTITKGRSLGGLGMYLLHDKREGEAGPHPETDERVTWTHTLNLLEDDPHEALREMIATAQAQAMLRQMAGQRQAGRPTKDSAYHVALSWEPSERPSKAHMIEAAQSFLRHMGHTEFQCLMVAHAPDASGRLHLHLELCRIHPLTGATMRNPKNDYSRAQAWAKQYQDERGQEFCAERTKRAEGKAYRNLHMPRWQWEQWKKTGLSREAFLDQVRDELQEQAAARDLRGQQWDGLKAAQRAEREQFFRDTKEGAKGLRAEVWVAVKAEFAPRWQAYARKREWVEAERHGYSRALAVKLRQAGYRDWAGQLRRAERQHAAELKAELTALRGSIQADQSARFAQVNDRAWQNFQQGRREVYRGLLVRQQTERHQLHAKQRPAASPPPAAPSRLQMALARAKAISEALRAAPSPVPAAKAPPAAPRTSGPVPAPPPSPTVQAQPAPPRPPPDLAPAAKAPSNAPRAPEPVTAPAAQAKVQAEPVRSAGTPPPEPRPSSKQGSKPMLDEEQKRKKAAAPSFFGSAHAAFPNPFDTKLFSVPPMPSEAPAREKSQAAHEQYLRETHAVQREKGEAPDPHAMAKAKQAERDLEARAQQRAREAAAQPYKGPAASPSGSSPKPLDSTENRPPDWKGGTPQYGFGFTPGSPPDFYGYAKPNIREHAPPQMPRAPQNAPLQGDRVRLDEAIKAQAERRRAEATAEQARLADRNRFDSARRTITELGPEAGGAGSPSTRLRSQHRGAGDEVTGTDRQANQRFIAERTRYSAGKEVTDRMAASSGRPVENTDRKQAASEREAKIAAMNAGAAVRAAREREGGRDR